MQGKDFDELISQYPCVLIGGTMIAQIHDDLELCVKENDHAWFHSCFSHDGNDFEVDYDSNGNTDISFDGGIFMSIKKKAGKDFIVKKYYSVQNEDFIRDQFSLDETTMTIRFNKEFESLLFLDISFLPLSVRKNFAVCPLVV
jgi:hypothetical protein